MDLTTSAAFVLKIISVYRRLRSPWAFAFQFIILEPQSRYSIVNRF
jgi:hypothetical protein